MSSEAVNLNFSQTTKEILVYSDLFSSVLSTKKKLIGDIKDSMNALGEKGKVTLSDGTEIDMNSTSGPMVLQMRMDQLNAQSTFVDSMFDSTKSYEKSLQNMLNQ